jgi:hypothetical protein
MSYKFLIVLSLLVFAESVSAKKEVVSFDLKFGFIKGGEAKFVVSDTIFNNRPAVAYNLAGRTTGLSDKLFAVDDEYETFVDPRTGLPLKSIRNIKEKKYRWYNETLYYPEIDSIYSQRSGWRSVPDTLVDIVSVFFYFINNHLMDGLEKGETIILPTFHADKISDVIIKYDGDRVVETDLGKINCHVLLPEVDKGKLLKRSDGLKFYISKKTKVPVLLEFDMRVGTLRAVLRSYTIDGVEQTTRE